MYWILIKLIWGILDSDRIYSRYIEFPSNFINFLEASQISSDFIPLYPCYLNITSIYVFHLSEFFPNLFNYHNYSNLESYLNFPSIARPRISVQLNSILPRCISRSWCFLHVIVTRKNLFSQLEGDRLSRFFPQDGKKFLPLNTCTQSHLITIKMRSLHIVLRELRKAAPFGIFILFAYNIDKDMDIKFCNYFM